MILRAITQQLDVICKPHMSASSFAYQEGKGVTEAVQHAVEFMNHGAEWVVEIDIESFFDHIELPKLEMLLYKMDLDIPLLTLLKKYLYCRIERDCKLEHVKRGIIQGSPLSPLLSNLYLSSFDRYLENEGYNFCWFSDDINIYVKDEIEAGVTFSMVEKLLSVEYSLNINKGKSGYYEAIRRRYLGFVFEYDKKNKEIIAVQYQKKKPFRYDYWHKDAIQKIDRNYHLINDGILTRRDYTILFENETGKMFLPVESVLSLNSYSNIIYGSSFFEFMNKKKLDVAMFDKFGNRIGTFRATNNNSSGKTMLKQAEIYLDGSKRLAVAKILIMAGMHNLRANLRYYFKKKHSEKLDRTIKKISEIIALMNESLDINGLMMLEAKGRQTYYSAYDEIIADPVFRFTKRTKRPPQDELNAMISFGNVFLYNRIAREINRTTLDIRIGFLHATNQRSESLNLDLAELFKPILIDRVVFTMINKKMIHQYHFEKIEKGVYLNKEGKKIFIEELEKKLYQKINVNGNEITYNSLLYKEVQKIFRVIIYAEKYKPYKYT